ncbi:type II toxin-antitoxin system RelE/ParE family toxin [Planctomycetota bacterium]
MCTIQITEPAKADIQHAFTWWAENHSIDQATAWYDKIYEALETLRTMPERCPVVPEIGLSETGIRQLLFGIGNRPTHRIIFAIGENTITVLRVRHHAQDEM